MDLTSHPAPFPPLKILRRFLALIASPSHCASVKPTWSLRKRSCHRAIGRGTEAREAPRAPSDLTIFPRVCHLLASPRLTPPTPVKTVVRTPLSSVDRVGEDLIVREPPERALGSTPASPSARCIGRCYSIQAVCPRLDGGD
jgi:hypothetical protein